MKLLRHDLLQVIFPQLKMLPRHFLSQELAGLMSMKAKIY